MTKQVLMDGDQYDDAVAPTPTSGAIFQPWGDVLIGSATGIAGRIVTRQDNILTIGSPGAGVSAVSLVAGSTNTAGIILATLTAIAPGVVIGVVAFDDSPLDTAPIAVVCSLSLPTAGVAAPPIVGATGLGTGGWTLRSFGPTTVTTASYAISYIVIFG